VIRRPATMRIRLTALYAGLFLAATTALLITVNLLLQRLLDRKIGMYGEQIAPGTTPPEGLPPPQPGTIQGTSVKTVQDLGDSVLAYQWSVTWIAVAVLGVVGAAAGWWMAGRVLRPVHRITATAQRLSLSNLHERIALTGPRDELKELADTFDAMLERLERATDSQRRFAANASHELRTPLAIQRAAIEIGLQDPSPDQLARMRNELLQANLRTERLIEGLLTLAQGEHGLEHSEPVDLAGLAREVTDQHLEPATGAGVELVLDLHPVTGSGDPVLLSRLIANLVHNAIRYNVPGGQVRIHTSTAAGLTVSNTGPEIPSDRVAELFEPFRRLHPPRTGAAQGAGLGLSIVAAIAEAHHAVLRARPNPGGGLIVEMRLRDDAVDTGGPVDDLGHLEVSGRG
jgi:signal transduction histidine kinase